MARDIPIIFSAPMIRALLDGRKTQTRRILKPQPVPFPVDDKGTMCDVGLIHIEGDRLPRITTGRVVTSQEVPYAVGDRLWVRECWSDQDCCEGEAMYRATACDDGLLPEEVAETRWRPSIHMPRWASRLTLIVEGVKVERLQDISEEDAIAEGVTADEDPFWRPGPSDPDSGGRPSHRNSFEFLWGGIYTPWLWDQNPWVAAISFRVERANIDALKVA